MAPARADLMIVVDTSVWIAWLRQLKTSGTDVIASRPDPIEIIVGDIVLLEVIQGARDDRHSAFLENNLRRYPVVKMLDDQLIRKAAANYRQLRSLGFTVRKTPDLIIGTYCIERRHSLLQNDRDFLPMAEHLGLQLV